jgi:hypothetical protein
VGDLDGEGGDDLVGAGGGTMSVVRGGTLTQTLSGGGMDSVAIGDYDGDGDSDLFRSGFGSASLFANSGGTLTEVAGAVGLPALAYGEAAWSDFDNDGHLDLLVCGGDATWQYRTYVLRGDSAGSFSESASLLGVGYGACLVADFDRDGDDDVFLVGSHGGGESVAAMYRNDGGSFVLLTGE